MYFLFGAVFAICGAVFWRFPPKKINNYYGYRTSSSMKSQKSWDVAQKCSARLMTLLGLACLATDAVAMYFFPDLSVEKRLACVMAPEMIVSVVVPLVVTEIAIKKVNESGGQSPVGQK